MADPIRVAIGNDRGYSIFHRPLKHVPTLMQDHGLSGKKCLVITDLNVGALYAHDLTEALHSSGYEVRTVTLPPGEKTKSFGYLHEIYDVALSWRIDRQTSVLALGGGVIGDLAGFAAATLLRGLPLVQLPTSLLAQVDSAIGGKTGINHESGKNLIGAFHQPVFVCADSGTLKTLSDAEWKSGLAEVVKHGLIEGKELFDWLSSRMPSLVDRSSDKLLEMIRRASGVKAQIVSADEKETGKRAYLNLGHTFGHALEKVVGFGVLSHGEAVTLGTRAAIHVSARRSPESEFSKGLELLSQLSPPELPSDLDIEKLIDAMALDKKARGNRVRLILLHRIGEAYVADDVSKTELVQAWRSILTTPA